MSKEIYISSTPHETRLAIVENDNLAEIYYERENEYTLAGSIYNGKVTRVLPGMQSSFVDIGLERDAFLYITDFMEEAGDAADFEGNANAGDHPRRTETRSESSRTETPRADSSRDGNRDESRRTESRSEGSRDGRRGNRDDRGNREDRGNRSDRDTQPRSAEPSDADLFHAAVAGVDPIRPEATRDDSRRDDRNRRGGRGRGRGEGRDRSLNSDGTPRRDAQGNRDESRGNRDENFNRADILPETPAPILSSPAESTEELGEGAPGADGSRRWRGRRGRRSNRGTSTGGQIGNQSDSPIAPATDFNQPPAMYPDAELAESTQPTDTPIYESYADAEPQNLGTQIPEESRLDLPAAPPAPRSASRDDNRGNRDSRSGGRSSRDRNDRGDRNTRSANNFNDSRGANETRRVPRGFAPSTSLYKVEGADETQATPAYGQTYGQDPEFEAPAEPVILPGESLRKYRPAAEADQLPESITLSASATPAASSFVAQGWDGGAVLPGETLRPRGPLADSAPRPDPRSSSESRPDRNSRDRSSRNDRGNRDSRGNDRSRDSRGNRTPRPETLGAPGSTASPSTLGSSTDATPQTEARTTFTDTRNLRAPQLTTPEYGAPQATLADLRPEASELQNPVSESPEPTSPAVPTYLSDPEHAPASHLITPLHSTFVAPPPMPEPAAAQPAEYEPTEASASFRVDPTPPSEFRHASPVFEVEAAEPAVEPSTPQANLETAAFAEPEALAAEPTPEPTPDLTPEPVLAAPIEHDPSDLHSVSPALAHAFQSTPEPTTPQPHELQSHELQPHELQPHELTSIGDTGNMHSEPLAPFDDALPALQEPEPTEPIAHETAIVETHPMSQPVPHFAPGDGALEEEEMLDDDEDAEPGTPLPLMQAHSAEEFEQETLENAADLGTMLREMSIDQITRTEPAIIEEDEDLDEDEDFLEEDQNFDSAQLSSDDDEDDAPHYPNDEGAEDDGYKVDQIENSEYGSGFEGEHTPQPATTTANSTDQQPREPRRDRTDRNESRDRNDRGRSRDGRRDSRGRRDGRDSRDRDRRSSSSEGGFSSPGADRIVSDRPYSESGSGRRDTRGGRNSAQVTNLPAISDLLKPGQELLCQIAKEPIAKKGARITSHIALPGRFLVFMPTVSHTGVSRKIESDGERRRLKEILLSEKGDAAGGFIVRTAAAGATEEELRSDLRFLLNLWADIKTRSESSKSPALIYHDLNLVERVLRDQVTDTFSAIWVDTESQYEQVIRFLQRFQPSLIRRVKLYTKETPLFEQFGITEEINKALRSKVWLKSGGSIVINQTEALVAIDINTGKFVGKTARLEDTIVKTNLDAIPEIVRQIRLRDLGGIIIIDFIDMDERKNRNKVLAALEEELKADRAPSKVLNFNDFGLIAITRKRVKQSLERTLSVTCGVCAGTGMTKSPVTVCNDIYVEMRKMHKHLDRGDVMLRVHPEVVKQLKAPATNWLHEMEEMVGKTILVKSDPSLHPEQFDIH